MVTQTVPCEGTRTDRWVCWGLSVVAIEVCIEGRLNYETLGCGVLLSVRAQPAKGFVLIPEKGLERYRLAVLYQNI